MSPKQFVQQRNIGYSNQGVYTIIPLLKNGLLDLPFHINRLHSSFTLCNNLTNYDITNTSNSVLSSCKEALGLLDSNQIGYLTLSLGTEKESINDLPSVSSYFEKWENKIDSLKMDNFAIVDFYEFNRKPVKAKYSSWIEQRKFIEMNRGKEITETILCDKIENELLLKEGLISNLFLFCSKENIFLTPPENKILTGGMAIIVKYCVEYLGFELKEKEVSIKDIENYDCMFLTNVVKTIQPIKKIILPSKKEINFYFTKDHRVIKLRKFLHYFLYKKNEIGGGVFKDFVKKKKGYNIWLHPEIYGFKDWNEMLENEHFIKEYSLVNNWE